MVYRFTCSLIVALLGFAPHLADARLGGTKALAAESLTQSSFQEFMEKNGKVLVDFYDPKDYTGQHELEAAIRNIRANGEAASRVPFAKVDVSKEPELAAKYVPNGPYPQLMWFLHGEATKYHKTFRTAKAISDFVLSVDRSPMVLLSTEEDAYDLAPAVFARVPKDSRAYKTLEIVAQKHMDDVAFTFLNEKDMKNVEISFLGRSGEPVKYLEVLDVDKLERWVRKQLLKSEPIPEDPALLEHEGSKVVVGLNFEETVLMKHKDVILQVYAPGSDIEEFSPIWNLFAQEMQHFSHQLVVAKMDGSRNDSPLPEDFKWDSDSYPVVFFVPAGQRIPVRFQGERTVQNLQEFVSRHSTKPLKEGAVSLIQSSFQGFIENHDKVLVDFYDDRENQSELESAIRKARSLGSKVPFATVDVSKEFELASKYVPNGRYPQLVWFHHGEVTQYHRSLRSGQAIVDFVLALDREPMVAVKTEEAARDFVPAVFARVAKGSRAHKTLEMVAQKHMDTVAFTFLEDITAEIFWLGTEGKTVQYTEALDASNLEKWVQRQLLKSEPIPEDPALLEDEGSKVVVGLNFEDTVLQKDKDVILQVYAPWCGHCKKFSPIWNSFAQEAKDASNLVVAKMDGSRNGSPLPDFQWDSYPKVFLVPAGKKKPIDFQGERTVQSLIDFVNTHGSHPFQKDDNVPPESDL